MRLADLVLLPTRPTTDDLDALPAILDPVEEAGRPLADLPITIWGAREDREALLADRDLGVERVVVSLDAAKRDVILPELDRWAELARLVA